MSAYEKAAEVLLKEDGVELSTMMKTPCLRHNGNFFGMMFDKEDALIIKVSPERVNELVEDGRGREFKFTKKRFKEWVLIDQDQADQFEGYLREALAYVAP